MLTSRDATLAIPGDALASFARATCRSTARVLARCRAAFRLPSPGLVAEASAAADDDDDDEAEEEPEEEELPLLTSLLLSLMSPLSFLLIPAADIMDSSLDGAAIVASCSWTIRTSHGWSFEQLLGGLWDPDDAEDEEELRLVVLIEFGVVAGGGRRSGPIFPALVFGFVAPLPSR